MTRRDDDLDQLAEDELDVLSPDGDGMLLASGSGLAQDGTRWLSGATPAARRPNASRTCSAG